MHKEAKEYVLDVISEFKLSSLPALEIGSLDVNGSIREAFTGIFIGIDRVAGKGVDIVAEAADFDTDARFGVVISMEALEHTPRPADIIECAARVLKPGGRFIITCAAPPRRPHGCDGRRPPPEGEHYRNITPDELRKLLSGWANVSILYNRRRGDLYAHAMKEALKAPPPPPAFVEVESVRAWEQPKENHADSDHDDRRSARSVQALRTMDEPTDPPA